MKKLRTSARLSTVLILLVLAFTAGNLLDLRKYMGGHLLGTAMAQGGEGEGEGEVDYLHFYNQLTIDADDFIKVNGGPIWLNGIVAMGNFLQTTSNSDFNFDQMFTDEMAWTLYLNGGTTSYCYRDPSCVGADSEPPCDWMAHQVGTTMNGYFALGDSGATDNMISLSNGMSMVSADTGALLLGNVIFPSYLGDVALPVNHSGASMAAKDSGGNALAVLQLRVNSPGEGEGEGEGQSESAGEVFLGNAINGTIGSSITIDSTGNVIISLADAASSGSSGNTQQSVQNQQYTQNSQIGQSTPPTATNSLLGAKLPAPPMPAPPSGSSLSAISNLSSAAVQSRNLP